MKKRILSTFLVVAMLLTMVSMTTFAAAASPFTDVPGDSWYAEYVDYAYQNGIVQGLSKTQFGPNVLLTRGMFVTLLYRIAGSPSTNWENCFEDVDAGAYYAQPVQWANDAGIVQGYPDGTFRPDRGLTRQEFATMLYRYAGMPTPAGTLNRFRDRADVQSYALDAMEWAVGVGILNGYTDSTLKPAKTITRAEATKMLVIYVQLPEGFVPDKDDDISIPIIVPGDRNVIEVAQDGTGDYKTIQAAANAVKPGQTILVHEGTYHEEVILPRGGTSDSKRITLKAAPGEEVVISASEPVTGWQPTETKGVYTLTLAKDFFSENAEGEYFNPFNTWWMSKGGATSGSKGNYYSCGCVYLNDTALLQEWNVADVNATANTWIAEVNEETGDTTLTVNFGAVDPNGSGVVTEVNNRMQCVTAKWNQGYITIDGITAIRGCGPKTIDFWMTTAEAMYGAIATNGGHHWIIENCELTQNRGVAIDFGNGSAKQELKYGGEPDLYGYHIIRYCNVHDNGTNGMMAYRGPYTEIYGCTLSNNNTLNTGLLSEAYIKDVSGGWGINIHDNYFYTDLDGAARPIWLDCECEGSIIANNVICDANNGFTYMDLECNAGWILVANNVLVSTGWGQVLESHSYLVNNLFLMNGQTSNTTWNSNSSTAMPGAEGYDGYSRAMRVAEPGTLNMLGKEETSRFETYNRFNKFLGNIMFDQGPVAAKSRNEVIMAATSEEFNNVFTEVYLNPDPASNPDYSGGCWKDPAMNEKYDGILAWIPVEGDNTLKTGTMLYGNECDYNVYYGGAQKIDAQYSTEYKADEHSIVVDGGSYSFTATPDSFELVLNVDDSVSAVNAPLMTGEYLGKSTLHEKYGIDFYAPDVDTDFFGNARDAQNTVAGPFADLEAGTNTYVLWPTAEAGKVSHSDPFADDIIEVAQDGTGDFTTIQAAANVVKPGQTIVVHEGIYREEVVLPRGGTDEAHRITLKAAEGDEGKVIVTGSDPVDASKWSAVEGMPGVYKLEIDNNYFPGFRESGRFPGATADLEEYNPFNQFWRSRADSSSPMEKSADGTTKYGYVSCGMVYLNGEMMQQLWSLNGESAGITSDKFGTVKDTPNSWIAYVDTLENGNPDKNGGKTTIYANFGDVKPTDANFDTEINVRMQCVTALWNQGYITIDGLKVMRGAGPKTVDFWQTRAEGMFGAISTNGGYHWIIENCDVTQCRGVAIDFGNGSRGQEDRYGKGYNYDGYTEKTEGAYNGNGPELYGYHTIRNCDIYDNATNGVFAYRGAYTEVYGCNFINNNCINTGLASEAYFKNVSGGYGINLHDNYFYSDQPWDTMPIWMDCENDYSIVANNVIYGAGKGENGEDGFSTISYELNGGWTLVSNNVIVNAEINNGVNGNMNVVNNLLINTGAFNVIGSASQARGGAEGGTSNEATIFDALTPGDTTSARNRTNRVVYPGTLDEVTTVNNPTSRFDGYSRYNKFMGNIVYDLTAEESGWSSPANWGKNYEGDERVTGYGEFILKDPATCEPGHIANPDFSGGVAFFHYGLPDVVELQQKYSTFDWAWIYAAGEAGNKPIARTVYGNEAEYNVYYGELPQVMLDAWEERGLEGTSLMVENAGNTYEIDADKDHFTITLTVDDSAVAVGTPLFTSEFMGPSNLLKSITGLEYCPPSVTTDILGTTRNASHNVAGPFADLEAGTTTYVLWPAAEAGKVSHTDPEPEKEFVPGSYTASNGTTVLYQMREGTADGQPLVIWQHGSGAVGTDNQKQLTANDNACYLIADYTPDCTVLAAQYPYKFSTPYLEGEEADMDAWLAAYAELIESLCTSGQVDADRVYLAGGSMGGGIVMEFITQYPELFAAAVAMCPRGTINDNLSCLTAVQDLPLWLFHTDGDTTNAPEISDEIYAYLTEELNSTAVRYTRYTAEDMEKAGIAPNLTHNASWQLGLAEEELFPWLFSCQKNA